MATEQQAIRGGPQDYSFLLKMVGAAMLVTLADLLFYLQRAGSTLGLFALALLLLTVFVRPGTLRNWPARCAVAAAALFTLVLAADPGLLAALLYWTALTMAALMPRTARFDDGWRWLQRLGLQALIAPFGLYRDRIIARRARRRRKPIGLARKALVLILPLAGSAVFITLFAQANPLIGDAFARLDLRFRFDLLTVIRMFFWLTVLVMVWSVLRPARVRLNPAGPGIDPGFALPGVTVASVTLSLAAFNLIFLAQNGLDLAFLWSGAPLPDGMTLAEYAHRGAYPLIATALLAGLFVLVTLRPGSATAGSRPIRLLVTLWIAQNLLLVASTMLRTFDYIEAYSLTRLRIAALIWMALVAVGLALICYRLLRAKSGAWLINANMLAALIVLGLSSTVDFGRMAAAWNVRHAREAGGSGAALDLCYLSRLGSSALLPLIEIEGRRIPPELRDRLAWLRTRTMAELARDQADWHGWTWRGARRLEAANARAAALRLRRHRGEARQCDGRPFPPPPPAPPATTLPEAVPPPAASREGDLVPEIVIPEVEAEPAKPLTEHAGR